VSRWQKNTEFSPGIWDILVPGCNQAEKDQSAVKTPQVCIVDATEFVIRIGPFRPGKLHKPINVVAGVDRVAINASCCALWPPNTVWAGSTREK